jgi:ParB family chromosome partitioning protein
MSKTGSAAKVKLNSFDDLFGTEKLQTGTEQVQEIALSELHEFKGHPFKVLDDEKMQETVESIREHGVLMPGIARPMKDGGYEIIDGHRRRHACELVGLTTMSMFIRDYTDDEATIIMVDSNIQREDILPSEKAKAYRMKYDAIKHQGSKEGGLTLGELGEAAGESAKTVQRYIWISRLSDSLLDMVDAKKIGIMQAVDLSFLSEDAQQWVLVAIQETNVVITTQQSAMLKESDKKGELTFPMVRMMLEKEKTVERKVVIKTEHINNYFPATYSREQIENIIYQLLENSVERRSRE